VLALVADLMFDSRVRSTAQHCGVAATTVRTPRALTDSLDESSVELVIIDLDAHLESVQAVGTVRSRWPTIPVLAFGSHVNEALLQAARDAGAERVWPRSRFSASLDAVMGEVRGKGQRDGGT
jgi:DNA-binding NarL/FixJ family response regulator